jgi:MFS family permease
MKNFYRFEFFRALSSGLISPFISIFALTLGASNLIIGYTSAFTQLCYISFQLLISFILVKKKKALGSSSLFFATFFWAFMWLIIGKSKNPYELLLFLGMQAIFTAIIALSWTNLIVSSIPSHKRGRTISELNRRNAIGSIIATLIAGYILNKYGFVSFVFFASFFFGILASINFFSLKQIKSIIIKTNLDVKKDEDNSEFKKLLIGRSFLNFSVGIAAPFLSVYVVKNLGGTTIDIALISITSSLFTILFYRPWGFVVDFVGRKITMLSSLILISTIPLFYAIAPNPIVLYFLVPIGSIGWAGFDIASFAYFSDVIAKRNAFKTTALYNASIEFSTIIGNFFGSFIAQFYGIFYVLIISFILRLFSMPLFVKIKDTKGSKDIKIETAEPIKFIEESVTLYLILFSSFEKNVRKDIFLKIRHLLRAIGKEMRKRLFE